MRAAMLQKEKKYHAFHALNVRAKQPPAEFRRKRSA